MVWNVTDGVDLKLQIMGDRIKKKWLFEVKCMNYETWSRYEIWLDLPTQT